MQDNPVIPHGLMQILGLLLASSLGWLGGWITRRKREPVEIAKLTAETRQITVNTDVSLIQAATQAIGKAERLQDERDHWERKSTALQLELDQAGTQQRMDELQIRKMKGLLDVHGIKFSERDGH